MWKGGVAVNGGGWWFGWWPAALRALTLALSRRAGEGTVVVGEGASVDWATVVVGGVIARGRGDGCCGRGVLR